MNKRYSIKTIYAICSIISMIVGPIFAILGVILLFFSPIGKLFSIFIILTGLFLSFQGKAVASNEININDDFVYIKQGLGFKITEQKLDYNDIISVKGNKGGGVLFDTKTGVISVAYIDCAVECAELINERLKNGKFDMESRYIETETDKMADSNREIVKRINKLNNNRIVKENEHRCKTCGYIQSKTIQRCLKCGQLIEENDDIDISEEKYIEIICDNCQNHISVSKKTFSGNGSIICPKCQSKIR